MVDNGAPYRSRRLLPRLLLAAGALGALYGAAGYTMVASFAGSARTVPPNAESAALFYAAIFSACIAAALAATAMAWMGFHRRDRR